MDGMQGRMTRRHWECDAHVRHSALRAVDIV